MPLGIRSSSWGRGSVRGLSLLVKKALISLTAVGYVLSFVFPVASVFPGVVGEARAASRSLSNRTDWMAGEFSGTESLSSHERISLVPDGTWQPRIIEAPEWSPTTPGIEVSDGNYIYVLRQQFLLLMLLDMSSFEGDSFGRI